MKRWVVMFGMLACASVFAPGATRIDPVRAEATAQIERRQDRAEGEGALKDFVAVAGTWAQNGTRLSQTEPNASDARALSSAGEWVDCIFKARIRVDSASEEPGSGLRLILRADSAARTFYSVGFYMPEQQVRIERAADMEFETLRMFNNNSGPFDCQAIAPIELTPGQTYDVTVIADHAVLHCFVDGQFVVRGGVADFMENPGGKVGFYAARASGEFAAVSVEPLHGVLHSPFRFHERNPIQIGARSPSILHEGDTYKMWYDGPDEGLGYAESKDGFTWTKPAGEALAGFVQGSPGQWGDKRKNDAEVLKVDGKYRIFYPAKSSAINGNWDGMGLQFSPDGIHWTPYEQNPVFNVGPEGAFDEHCVGDHGWMKDGDRFKLWHVGINLPHHGYRSEFGYAESLDGIHWRKCRLNPILKMGQPGEWDAGWISCAAVIKLGDEELASGVYKGGKGSYHLFYTGWPTNNEHHPGSSRIGYAFSLDGVHWAKYKDPAFTRPPYQDSAPIINWTDFGKWGSAGYHSCALLREGDEVRMWIWGDGYEYPQLGVATAKVSDLLAIVEQARRDGRLEEFDRPQIDELMYDAPPSAK